MNDDKKINLNENNNAEFLLKAVCPACKTNSTLILDHKKINDEKSMHLCLICGQVFDYNKKNNKKEPFH